MAEEKDLDNELEKEQNPEEISLDDIAKEDTEEPKSDTAIEDAELMSSDVSLDDTMQPSLDENDPENASEELITVRPVKFQQFETSEPNRSIKKNLDIMQDVSMHISVELGKAKSTIKEVMDYKEGSIVELDKIAGEQVEVYANNKLVAKGEVIVIEDKFGVRVTSTNLPKPIQ